MVFGWVKLLNTIWPKQSLSIALRKAVVEQVTYAPVAISLFLFTMALFDNDFNFEIAQIELKRKFWDGYKVMCDAPFS